MGVDLLLCAWAGSRVAVAESVAGKVGEAEELCLEVWEMPGSQRWAGAVLCGVFSSSCSAVELGSLFS